MNRPPDAGHPDAVPPDAGRLCWWDLVCRDVAGAQASLTRLLGWEVEGIALGEEVYPMAGRGGSRWGGFVELPEDRNLPDHWLPYLAVDDLDTACAAVLSGGGHVLTGPEEVPEMGTYAVCEGPDRCWFAVHVHARPAAPWPAPPTLAGAPWGAVLASPAPEKSAEFFNAVLGWSLPPRATGGQVNLADGSALHTWIARAGAQGEAPTPDVDNGLQPASATGLRPDAARWLPGFGVADTAAVLADAAPLQPQPWPVAHQPPVDARCLGGPAIPPFFIRGMPRMAS